MPYPLSFGHLSCFIILSVTCAFQICEIAECRLRFSGPSISLKDDNFAKKIALKLDEKYESSY